MAETYFYETRRGHGLPHDPFKAIVAPRPIGWISSIDNDGRVNLAPYSFFNGVADNPPMVMFSSMGRKDSLYNIEQTGEFVANLATMHLAQQMNKSSMPLPHGVNEMEMAGLAAAPSKLVKPPRVADAAAALECKLVRVIQLADLDSRPLENFVIIGQVVGVHIDPACLKNGLFDMTAARTIARCGYAADYVEVDRLFQMTRPKL